MKILIVGMADSVHLSRWLAQFNKNDIEFEIVSSSPHRKVHPEIWKLLRNSDAVRMHWVSIYLSLPMWLMDRVLSDWVRGCFLAWRIRRFLPDIVHVNELQNAGYCTRRAWNLIGDYKPKLIITNYGSELNWYAKFPRHQKKLSWLVQTADGFSAECQRDYDLARQLSSKFRPLAKLPVSGGIEPNSASEGSRQIICVKGYQNRWGKALFVLRHLRALAQELRTFEIVVFSCNASVYLWIKWLQLGRALNIRGFRKGALSHKEVLSLLSRSKVFIGHSLSDGISTSMLEAMAMGAIPIQTSTSCASEWFQDKVSGFLITPFDSDQLKESILMTVSDSFDFGKAQMINYSRIRQNCNPEEIAKIARNYYVSLGSPSSGPRA